jgi:hypothetical protein
MSDEPDDLSDVIEEMLEDGRYKWATETLRSVASSVAQGRVTEAQRRAVFNIKNSRRALFDDVPASEHDEGLPTDRLRGSRRYEGWGNQ